jgi:hypothetical protein
MSQEQWESTHAWEPVSSVPHFIRQKYPSMNFKLNDHYIVKGKTYHYRVFEGLRVERTLKGRKGLVGRGVPRVESPVRKKILGVF